MTVMATESTPRSRKAGAFDIRLIIALLTGVYGIILTVMGAAFDTEADRVKSAGVNINLWAGIALLIFTALFVLWARLRPIVVPTQTEQPDEDETTEPPSAG
jgi:TRAP-type C4-dicarboxylate transport system permease small subunit